MVRKTKEAETKSPKADDKAKDTAKAADKDQNYDQYWANR